MAFRASNACAQVMMDSASSTERETTVLKSVRTNRFAGKRLRWSPQKLIVMAVPGFTNVTAVKGIVAPVGQ